MLDDEVDELVLLLLCVLLRDFELFSCLTYNCGVFVAPWKEFGTTCAWAAGATLDSDFMKLTSDVFSVNLIGAAYSRAGS